MGEATIPAADLHGWIGGRYRLVECVRVDGDRQSWRAVDEVARRPVRVWLYRIDPASAAELRERVRMLSLVRHPGLVSVYDLVDHENEAAVITEPIAGRSVADLVRGGQRPSLGTVRAIVSSLADALDELHLSGRIATAIALENVFLRADGAAALLDASLAAPERSVGRPDILALEELARALVLGASPRPELPQAVRLAVERVSGSVDRYRSARDFAGNLASAISFDDRTEVLPRERWLALRKNASVRTRARLTAGALILSISLAGGGIAASATTRAPEREAARTAPATAASSAPATAAGRVAPITTSRGIAPSVLGLARDDAAGALLAAGAGSVTWRVDPKAKGVTRVVRQDPPAGQPLARGAQATLYLDSASQR